MQPRVTDLERPTLLQREEDLAFLKRWLAGAAPIAVIYGSRGMGKTALGWAFAEGVPRAVWMEIKPGDNLESFADSLAHSTGQRASDPDRHESVAAALVQVFAGERKLLVVDGFADVDEPIVDALSGFLRGPRGRGKLLVLAQESTPAYCRFYSKADVDAGLVAERHLHGLDLEGCRAMLGRPAIDAEGLRRVYPPPKRSPPSPRGVLGGGEGAPPAPRRLTKGENPPLCYSR